MLHGSRWDVHQRSCDKVCNAPSPVALLHTASRPFSPRWCSCAMLGTDMTAAAAAARSSLHQVGTKEGELDSLLHKRLNAGLSTLCIAQALLLVSVAHEDCQQGCNMQPAVQSQVHPASLFADQRRSCPWRRTQAAAVSVAANRVDVA